MWLVHDLVENLNASLHIYNDKSKQSLSKFFFVTLSLSTELLEDKQRFKLGGVDLQTLLPLFWTLTCMIWMELTRTHAVFSRTAMVLFLCRNKSSRNDLKIHGELLENIKNTCKKIQTRGPHPVHEGGGRPPAQGAPPASWAPWCSTDVSLDPIYSLSGRKKPERKNYRVLRYSAATKP